MKRTLLSATILLSMVGITDGDATPASVNPATYWINQPNALATLQANGAPDGTLTPSVGASFSFFVPPPGIGTVADVANSTPGWTATGPVNALLDDATVGVDGGSMGTIFHFTGSIALQAGDVISMEHDDGVILSLGGGLAIDSPAATSPTLDTYTVLASGVFPFDLQYGECCTLPVVLEWDVNGSPVTNVPEPTPLAVLGIGLLGLGMIRRRV